MSFCFSSSLTETLVEALTDTSVSGLFGDLVSFLLTTIFQLEVEEEEYDDSDDVMDTHDASGA